MDKNKLDLIKHFIKFCKKELNIQSLPKISLIKDRGFVESGRSFGEYNPQTVALKVYYPGRNLADVCRSLAHELCHHRQNELGMIYDGSGETGTDIENDAHAMAGILMRDYGKLNMNIYDLNNTSTTEFLPEAKQVGMLYHFTNYSNMVDIIKHGYVLKSNIQPYVSFTRNKLMYSDTIPQGVRITVNGDELSHRYQITPHADVKAGYGRNVNARPGERLTGDESEERISLDKYPNGVDISKYIEIIEVKQLTGTNFSYDDDDFEPDDEDFTGPPSLEAYDTLLSLLKKGDKPYKIVKNYK